MSTNDRKDAESERPGPRPEREREARAQSRERGAISHERALLDSPALSPPFPGRPVGDNPGWQTLALAGIAFSVRLLDGVDIKDGSIEEPDEREEETAVDGRLPELVGGAWHIPDDIPEHGGQIVTAIGVGPAGYRRKWHRIGGDS